MTLHCLFAYAYRLLLLLNSPRLSMSSHIRVHCMPAGHAFRSMQPIDTINLDATDIDCVYRWGDSGIDMGSGGRRAVGAW